MTRESKNSIAFARPTISWMATDLDPVGGIRPALDAAMPKKPQPLNAPHRLRCVESQRTDGCLYDRLNALVSIHG